MEPTFGDPIPGDQSPEPDPASISGVGDTRPDGGLWNGGGFGNDSGYWNDGASGDVTEVYAHPDPLPADDLDSHLWMHDDLSLIHI